MEHRHSQPAISSANPTVASNPAMLALGGWDSYRPISLETDHGLAVGSLEQYDCEPLPALVLDVPTDALDPQMLERLPYGSSLASSSISSTGSVCTPSNTDMPIWSTLTSPAFEHVQSPHHSDAGLDELEPRWQHSHPEPSPCSPRALSVFSQRCPACHQELLERIRDFVLRSGPLPAPCCLPFQTSVPYPAAEVVAPAPLQQDQAVGPSLSEEDSESESDMFSCEDRASLCGSSDSSARRSGPYPGVMKLGRWGHITYPFYKVISARQYWCPLMDNKNPQTRCTKTFQRPEHLRRHVTTVHGRDKCHLCKVCPKLFSRRDNLREHYWTHVKRGGRAGKNVKMTIPELTSILGPREKRLLKRLRGKLATHQAKRTEGRP